VLFHGRVSGTSKLLIRETFTARDSEANAECSFNASLLSSAGPPSSPRENSPFSLV